MTAWVKALLVMRRGAFRRKCAKLLTSLSSRGLSIASGAKGSDSVVADHLAPCQGESIIERIFSEGLTGFRMPGGESISLSPIQMNAFLDCISAALPMLMGQDYAQNHARVRKRFGLDIHERFLVSFMGLRRGGKSFVVELVGSLFLMYGVDTTGALVSKDLDTAGEMLGNIKGLLGAHKLKPTFRGTAKTVKVQSLVNGDFYNDAWIGSDNTEIRGRKANWGAYDEIDHGAAKALTSYGLITATMSGSMAMLMTNAKSATGRLQKLNDVPLWWNPEVSAIASTVLMPLCQVCTRRYQRHLEEHPEEEGTFKISCNHQLDHGGNVSDPKRRKVVADLLRAIGYGAMVEDELEGGVRKAEREDWQTIDLPDSLLHRPPVKMVPSQFTPILAITGCDLGGGGKSCTALVTLMWGVAGRTSALVITHITNQELSHVTDLSVDTAVSHIATVEKMLKTFDGKTRIPHLVSIEARPQGVANEIGKTFAALKGPNPYPHFIGAPKRRGKVTSFTLRYGFDPTHHTALEGAAKTNNAIKSGVLRFARSGPPGGRNIVDGELSETRVSFSASKKLLVAQLGGVRSTPLPSGEIKIKGSNIGGVRDDLPDALFAAMIALKQLESDKTEDGAGLRAYLSGVLTRAGLEDFETMTSYLHARRAAAGM